MSGLDKELTPLFMQLVNALVARILALNDPCSNSLVARTVTGTDPWGSVDCLFVLNIWHCYLKSRYSRYETDTVVA
jgi:hypothetical protein